MSIEVNGVTLPDIPSDVLAQYPYAMIVFVQNNEAILNSTYTCIAGQYPLYCASEDDIDYALSADIEAQADGDVTVLILKSGVWETLYEARWGIECGGAVSDHEYATTVWANHDVYTVDMATAEVGDIYFPSSVSVSHPTEYSILHDDVVFLADQTRRLTGATSSMGFQDIKDGLESVVIGGGGDLPDAEQTAFGVQYYFFPFECYQTAAGTTLTGTIEAKAGDWVLATVTTRSGTTFPDGWTVLRESTALSSDNLAQRMAFICKQVTEDGTVSCTITQSSSARIYLNLITCSNIQGFAYHDGTEVYSNTAATSITVTRPAYECVIWGCTCTFWNTSSPYGSWSCGSMLPICLDQSTTQPRQANFVDAYPSDAEREFINCSSGGSAYIIDCVEVLTTEPLRPVFEDKYSITGTSLNGLAEQVQRLSYATEPMTPEEMETALENIRVYQVGTASVVINSTNWVEVSAGS